MERNFQARKRRFALTATLLVWFFCSGDLWAAPHISGRPEPATAKVGVFRERQLQHPTPQRAVTQPFQATALRILFLKVDFPADSNPDTSGTGLWIDPVYAVNGDSDYWVDKNRIELAHYYHEVSHGRLTLTIDVAPAAAGAAYRLPREMAAYGDESPGAIENLIIDAVNAAAAKNLSFAGYDAILIVHAGAGEETDRYNNTSRDIWSLYYSNDLISADDSDTNPPLQINNSNLTEAILMPQTGDQDGFTVDPLGIYAHEFGHFLGLPDLYPTAGISRAGSVDSWCLMDAGTYNRLDDSQNRGSLPGWPSAWCRLYLGWEEPFVPSAASDPGLIGLLPVEAAAGATQMVKLPVTADTPSSYFLLENRQKLGFDGGLSGHGLLVWQINSKVINQNLSANTVNKSLYNPGVQLVRADSGESLESRVGPAAAGNPFPGSNGVRALTPTTKPVSSQRVTGAGWVNLREIEENNGNISASIGFGPAVGPSITSATFNFGTTELDWSPLSDSTLAGYNVYRNGKWLAATTDTYFAEHHVGAGAEYAVASFDAAGDETVAAPPVAPTLEMKSSGGKCFIATAAYGSYEAPTVKTLRLFRDRILLTNPPGRLLVKTYYALSPPLAAVIADSPVLRGGVRILLLPVIVVATFCVVLTTGQQVVVLLSVVSLSFLFLRRLLVED
jgi:immune inhibitor A